MNIFFLPGYKKYKVAIGDSARIINICSKISLVTENHKFSDSHFSFDIPYFDSRRFESILAEEVLDFECVGSFGFFPRLLKYKIRVGMLAGFLMLICFTVSSSTFLWNIDVKGNENISYEDMIATLENSGLYLGCYLPKIDTDKVESAVLAGNKQLSWISINISGNTAYVEVRECVDINEEMRVLPYANIVAAEDAIITDIEIFSGMGFVKRDTYVRKGELLISGVITKEALGTYLTYARGNVYGKNFEETEIIVPYVYEKLYDTGKKRYGIKINFFSNSCTFLPIGFSFENYNEHTDVFSLAEGNKKLPISFTRIVFSENEFITETRDKNEAEREALLMLDAFFAENYSNAEILSKEIEFVFEEDFLILRCGFWYEKEIGMTLEFETEQ